MSYEINFDSLVGLTHYFGGLSRGNLASMQHKKSVSNPQAAALQGLEKMLFLAKLGIKQAVLPPHERPHLPTLRNLGFLGTDEEIILHAYQHSEALLMQTSSASAMWAANSAHISPSCDSEDGKVHITPANLIANFHRSIETALTSEILKKILNDKRKFLHHPPLPQVQELSDEGAANVLRIAPDHGKRGVSVFVYGRSAFSENLKKPKHFPARQTLEAAEAIARQHRLLPSRTVFAQQNPNAIDAGVFYNDVISLSNKNVFLYHEEAFVNTKAIIEQIARALDKHCGERLLAIPVSSKQLTINEALASYFFNGQLISQGEIMHLILPMECRELPRVQQLIDVILSGENPIEKVHYLELRQSMLNGGGPACLRLRCPVSVQEFETILPDIILDETLYGQLSNWIVSHYRQELSLSDLADPDLLKETQTALDELTRILKLGSIYSFQKRSYQTHVS